jgi:hypothetical protein
MTSKPFKLVRGKRLRATRLDGCGRPVYGESSVAVSDGAVSVAMTLNTSDTDAIVQQNMNGDKCVNEPAETEFSSYSVVITFCEVDPEVFSLITGQRVYLDANGNAVGFAVNSDVNLDNQGYALEVWAGVSAGSACDTEGAAGSWGYLLLPYLKGGVLGDHTIENGSINFTISGATTRDGNRWGSGPFNVMLGSAIGGTSSVQTVSITGTPTSGTFTLSFGGQTTAPIQYNAIASAVQTALQALSSVGAGNATVTGGPGPGTPYVITFAGALAQKAVGAITAVGSFSGGTSPAINVAQTTPGVNPSVPAVPLLTPLLPNDHELLIEVGVAPPDFYAGTRPLLDPDSSALSSLTVAKGANAQTANFTFGGGLAGTPVWIDFGDGTWDYLPSGNGTPGASHVYVGSGTFTAQASSDGETWKTVSVTVPLP